MRKYILCCLFVVISFFMATSQSNFKNGYIITNKDDTISGLIDFRTDHSNSIVCKFKFSENDSVINYLPGDITAYRFINEGKYYLSRTVIVDSIQQKVFLEFLVQGLLNLYYLHQVNDYYFFENKDGSLIEITKKPDVIIENNKLKVDNRYKGILSYIFRDYLPLAMNTSKADFSRKSMIVITKEYHENICDSGEKCIIFENNYNKKFTKFDFTVYSGLELNKIKFDDLSQMYSVSPMIGTEFEVSSPRLLKPVSITFDVNFSKVAGEDEFSSDNSRSFSLYNFSAIKSNISSGVKYNYDKGKIRPSIEVALTKSILFNSKSVLKNEFLDYSSVIRESEIENKILPENSHDGISAGIGLNFLIKNEQFIVVKLMYFSNIDKIDSNKSFQLKLGYKF